MTTKPTIPRMRLSLIFSLLLASSSRVHGQSNETEDADVFPPVDPVFFDCDIGTYYSGMPDAVTDWDREMIHELITQTHRVEVNLTNSLDPGIDDVWGALIDVDAGDEPNTVRLIYSNEETPQEPFGGTGWVRDYLFPLSRGIGVMGIDVTDIHNIRPASSLSNIVAGDKYFGQCQVLTQPETCIAPAEGSADDTCSCNRIFEPPSEVKGDIARALMYMDLRYDGTELSTRDLRLTDCPFQAERDMAYLSQMLTWHAEDPPDEREMERNNKVCTNWQGNRNPFVDFPNLANVIFGAASPLPAVGERLIYEKCEALPTLAPTFAANQCDMYDEGDFVIWLLNSNNPLSIGLYSFVPMEEGFELYITDNPWDGEKFVEQQEDDDAPDGTIKFVAPNNFGRGGRLFGIGLGETTDQSFADRFEDVEGTLSPSLDGEPIFIYCITASGDQRPLTVFNNGGRLVDPGLEEYADEESALPIDFPESGIINLPHFDNLLYSGENPSVLSNEELKDAVRDPTNWQGSNDSRYGLSGAVGTSTLRMESTILMILLTMMVGGAIVLV